jgi:hypothetical protein
MLMPIWIIQQVLLVQIAGVVDVKQCYFWMGPERVLQRIAMNGLDGKSCRSYANFLAEYKKHPKRIRLKEAVREINRSAQKYCNQSAQNYCNPWMGPAIRFKPLDFDIDYHRSSPSYGDDGWPICQEKRNLKYGYVQGVNKQLGQLWQSPQANHEMFKMLKGCL